MMNPWMRFLPAGSSPRGRGKRGHGPLYGGRERLIPARAGKTPMGPIDSQPEWAHPRAGGENFNDPS